MRSTFILLMALQSALNVKDFSAFTHPHQAATHYPWGTNETHTQKIKTPPNCNFYHIFFSVSHFNGYRQDFPYKIVQ